VSEGDGHTVSRGGPLEGGGVYCNLLSDAPNRTPVVRARFVVLLFCCART